MDTRTQNIAVGLTVIVALAMLAGMIVLFAGMPNFIKGGYEVSVLMEASGGLRDGDIVTMGGQSVGKVDSVSFNGPDPRQGVTVRIHIDRDYRIPADYVGRVGSGLLTGGATLNLKPASETTPPSSQFLPMDGSARITATVAPGAMDELADAMGNIKRLSDSISAILTLPEEAVTQAATQGGRTVPAFQAIMGKLNASLDALYTILGDKGNQENLRVSLADMREVADSAKAAMGELKGFLLQARSAADEATLAFKGLNQVTTSAAVKLDDLLDRLITDAEGVSTVLTAMARTIDKMQSTEGTLGKLLNDPHLYENLVDITDQIQSLTKDFRQLAEQWKEKGIGIKLK